MDLLRHIGWLRVLTVVLVAFGSAGVGAQPHEQSGIAADSGSGQGTVSDSGFSVIITSNAVGLMDVGPRGIEGGGVDSAVPSGWIEAHHPLRGIPLVFERSRCVPVEGRPLQHQLCVYRL